MTNEGFSLGCGNAPRQEDGLFSLKMGRPDLTPEEIKRLSIHSRENAIKRNSELSEAVASRDPHRSAPHCQDLYEGGLLASPSSLKEEVRQSKNEELERSGSFYKNELEDYPTVREGEGEAQFNAKGSSWLETEPEERRGFSRAYGGSYAEANEQFGDFGEVCDKRDRGVFEYGAGMRGGKAWIEREQRSIEIAHIEL